MLAQNKFSYACNRCGLCCRDKMITLSPYDVIRIARAAAISTGAAIARYTFRRGSLLRFLPDGRCAALEDSRCTIQAGRPLASRLYPLGLERAPDPDGAGYVERFVRAEPAEGSLGVYGVAGTVAEFLDGQEVAPYLDAIARYHLLLRTFRERVAATVDFERVEPREFWRCAAREALAEIHYDSNVLIDALFDPDGLGCDRLSVEETVIAHVVALGEMAMRERDGAIAAAAAVMLAVSLGYAPDEVTAPRANL
ncbi:MAG: YkgJ family cysteine cluster protein [Candidatus Binataceae bacterium]